ncbi:MAG: nickel-dependent lactate racemase [Lentisphaerae bacterium]|nr:nickel-dependent lactate racemase [Lentisphaerota bacterium]
MNVHLQYGREGLDVEIPGSNVTVIEPRFIEGLDDEAAAFEAAVRAPIRSPPLRETIGAGDTVAVLVPDRTRPFPSDRVLPWLFRELSHVPADRVTIVNGTGSHRINTPDELEAMLGRDILRRYRVVNHNAHDPATLAPAGKRKDGAVVMMNREYVRADRRIILGFIEPHFMAGFSGGYKAVFPGVADIDSIMFYHGASFIGDPRSTWGVLEGNPTQALVRECGALLPVDFCVNVTLNRKRRITRFFCGDVMAAHLEGCAFARRTAMAACARRFPVVVTTNGGYPLDQNLYQGVKGMSAAAQVVEQGGLIVAACECSDGFPAHGNFAPLLFKHKSPQAILDTILAPGFSLYDQWEAQLLAMILLKARVALYSRMPADDVRRAHLEPVDDLQGYIDRLFQERGSDMSVAVLPEGPMVIPYVEKQ